MSFENLTQWELIYLAGVFRVDYKDTIDRDLLTELHTIVHHHEETNPYHGDWGMYRRNCVIHQIFNKIVPKEDRVSFIEKHPLEKEVDELKRVLKEMDALYEFQSHEMFSIKKKEALINKKIRDYEDVSGIDDKQTAEVLRGSREDIINKIGYIRHLTLTILHPLIEKGWIKSEHIDMPNHPSGYRRVNQGPIDIGDLEQEQLVPELIYEGGGIPFEGVRNEDILDRHLPPYGFVCSLNDMKLKLMEKVTGLTDENNKLKKDNEILQTIIRDNHIDI